MPGKSSTRTSTRPPVSPRTTSLSQLEQLLMATSTHGRSQTPSAGTSSSTLSADLARRFPDSRGGQTIPLPFHPPSRHTRNQKGDHGYTPPLSSPTSSSRFTPSFTSAAESLRPIIPDRGSSITTDLGLALGYGSMQGRGDKEDKAEGATREGNGGTDLGGLRTLVGVDTSRTPQSTGGNRHSPRNSGGASGQSSGTDGRKVRSSGFVDRGANREGRTPRPEKLVIDGRRLIPPVEDEANQWKSSRGTGSSSEDERFESPLDVRERRRRRPRRELQDVPPPMGPPRLHAHKPKTDGLPTKEELQKIAQELRGPASAPFILVQPVKTPMMSIDEIIKKHSSTAPHAFGLSSRPAQPARSQTAPPMEAKGPEALSMAEMVQRSDALLRKLSDDHTPGLDRGASVRTSSTARGVTMAKTSTSGMSIASFDTSGTSAPIMEYLRSRRLNRLITLQRSTQAGQVVSLADVGNANGYPVLVFFGLGCVRYLIALFDELAETLKLRLICIDRWGLGKSTNVSADKRGLLEWANVVDEVMDQLKIRRFGILAHSAGAPYALAVAYKLEQRIRGKVHLLAPWVNADIDGGKSSGMESRRFEADVMLPFAGYKWLRYVPTGMLKTAQATEWKVQGWMLGRLPKMQSEGIGHNALAPSGFDAKSGIVNMGGQASRMDGDPEEDGRADFPGTDSAQMDRTFESGSSLASWAEVERSDAILSPKPERNAGGIFLGGMLSAVSRLSSAPMPGAAYTPSPPVIDLRPESRASDNSIIETGRRANLSRLSRNVSPPLNAPASVGDHSTIESSLVTCLLQASHAETLSGGTADLLAIMGRDSKPWGFLYEDVHVPCKIWYGERDDKISEKSMRWMEREMRDVELRIMRGEGHNLLTSSSVMMEVLESLASDAQSKGEEWSGR